MLPQLKSTALPTERKNRLAMLSTVGGFRIRGSNLFAFSLRKSSKRFVVIRNLFSSSKLHFFGSIPITFSTYCFLMRLVKAGFTSCICSLPAFLFFQGLLAKSYMNGEGTGTLPGM